MVEVVERVIAINFSWKVIGVVQNSWILSGDRGGI